jgi:L,D-transpeptidase-like protein/putative peptidoglycan binding protein
LPPEFEQVVVCNLRKLTFILLLVPGLLLIIPISSSAGTKRKRVVNRPPTRTELKRAERRLSEMGYNAGPADGVIDKATREALVLFQRWEGRKVTGQLTRREFDAIMNSEPPQPRDFGYAHVEVDLERQLLLLIDSDGRVERMLPVSTGSNKQYNEKGIRGLAYTPRGRFRIYAKIAGWRKSPLGLLYYPNYFSDGLAIHGNPSVPRSPQSHGCIRIPMSAAEAVSKRLPVGTIVLIYDSDSFVSAKDWAEADKQKQEAIIR